MTRSAEEGSFSGDAARRAARRLGIVIFLVSDGMAFAGLIAAAIVIRAGLPGWPPVELGLPLFSALLALLGALCLRGAARKARHGEKARGLLTLAEVFLLVATLQGFCALRFHPRPIPADFATMLVLQGFVFLHLFAAMAIAFACRISTALRTAWAEEGALVALFAAGMALAHFAFLLVLPGLR